MTALTAVVAASTAWGFVLLYGSSVRWERSATGRAQMMLVASTASMASAGALHHLHGHVAWVEALAYAAAAVASAWSVLTLHRAQAAAGRDTSTR